ncbi:hypothetical protein CVT26_015546 [Gymnopilus dilepis]|uniref:Uncharacterized protein n=1 Tax=Gymnopilus dilepis TaxID=231916 RepID=A0A409YD76_9AGAR|nr:hypothetical protein CVT26_015546 [Gymnopilus dilepis]
MNNHLVVAMPTLTVTQQEQLKNQLWPVYKHHRELGVEAFFRYVTAITHGWSSCPNSTRASSAYDFPELLRVQLSDDIQIADGNCSSR